MEECLVAHLHVVNGLHLGLIEPFYALAILPQAELHFIVSWHDVGAQAMLFTLVPVAFIASLVSPGIDAESMLLVVLVLSTVLSAIVPDVDAHALHIIVQPFTLVLASIEP